MPRTIKKLPKWAIKQAGGINKKAWALARRRQSKRTVKKKMATKRKVTRKSNPKGGVSTPNKSRKIGAVIQSVKATQPLVSPLIRAAARKESRDATIQGLRDRATISYAGNVAATAVNQVVDRKIAQGAALSRGSITAWLPEAFAALKVADEVKGQDARSAVLAANRKMARTINAYDPGKGTMDLTDADFRTYQALKLGGGIARRLSNMGPFKRITAPMKRLLGEMGGAL